MSSSGGTRLVLGACSWSARLEFESLPLGKMWNHPGLYRWITAPPVGKVGLILRVGPTPGLGHQKKTKEDSIDEEFDYLTENKAEIWLSISNPVPY